MHWQRHTSGCHYHALKIWLKKFNNNKICSTTQFSIIKHISKRSPSHADFSVCVTVCVYVDVCLYMCACVVCVECIKEALNNWNTSCSQWARYHLVGHTRLEHSYGKIVELICILSNYPEIYTCRTFFHFQYWLLANKNANFSWIKFNTENAFERLVLWAQEVLLILRNLASQIQSVHSTRRRFNWR